MKFETIKSIILTVLVIGSIFLTWSIWAYKPQYDPIKQNITNKPISDVKKIPDLIKPDKIVLHQNHTLLGTVKNEEIDRIINELQSWDFLDIGNSKNVSKTELRYLIQDSNHMDIEFPSPVPFDIYKGILKINKRQTASFDFDRILINFDKGQQKENIYFIDSETRRMSKSTVRYNEIQSFINKTKQKQSVYKAYEPIQVADGRTLYLPKTNIEMASYQYSVKDKDELENFKKVLFSDPNSVPRMETKDKIEYISTSSLLKADLKTNVLSFVNPASENNEYTSDPRTLLKQSIDFVNEHGGWTDQFQYFALDNNAHEVVFRLYMDGYPVFNSDDMAEIQQFWGENDIFQYRRPYISLEVQLKDSQKSLKPAKEILKDLLAIPHVQIESIKDLKLGYKLQKAPDSSEILSFEPTWYCLYDGTWSPVSEIGRVQNGME